MPVADDLRGKRGVGKAHAFQNAERFRIVIGAGEGEVPFRRGKIRRFLEQGGIDVADGIEHLQAPGGEAFQIGKTGEVGQAQQILLVCGQCLGLFVIDHLQAVFQHAQKAVGADHPFRGFRIGPAAGGKGADGGAGGALAQAGIASPGYQLLGLGEEFDFADAAAPDLQIVPGNGDFFMPVMGIDLAFDRMDVLDGGKVEIFPPDEGSEIIEKSLARPDVAGDGPGLDHGRAFPVLAQGLVIILCRLEGDGQRRYAGIGTQAQIGAEDIAVCRPVLQHGDEFAHQAGKKVGRMASPAIDMLLLIVEDDQVDIAGIVQLARAQLAHADDRQPGRGGIGRAGLFGQFAAFRRFGQQVLKGGFDGEIGIGAQRCRDFFKPPATGQIHSRRQQGDSPLAVTQRPHHPFLAAVPGDVLIHGAEGLRKQPVGVLHRQPAGEFRLHRHHMGKIGAVGEQGAHDGAEGGVVFGLFQQGGKAWVFVYCPVAPSGKTFIASVRIVCYRQGWNIRHAF